MEGVHPLAQAAKYQERSVDRPVRPAVRDRPGFGDVAVFRILTGVSEHELAGPQEILTRLALATVVGVLAQGQHVAWIVGKPSTNPGLRDPVEESKVLVAGEHVRQGCTLLLKDLRRAGQRTQQAAHLVGEVPAVVARDDDQHVYGNGSADLPFRRVALGRCAGRITQTGGARSHPILERLIEEGIGVHAKRVEAVRGERDVDPGRLDGIALGAPTRPDRFEQAVESDDLCRGGDERDESLEPRLERVGVIDLQAQQRLVILVEAAQDVPLDLVESKNRLVWHERMRWIIESATERKGRPGFTNRRLIHFDVFDRHRSSPPQHKPSFATRCCIQI